MKWNEMKWNENLYMTRLTQLDSSTKMRTNDSSRLVTTLLQVHIIFQLCKFPGYFWRKVNLRKCKKITQIGKNLLFGHNSFLLPSISSPNFACRYGLKYFLYDITHNSCCLPVFAKTQLSQLALVTTRPGLPYHGVITYVVTIFNQVRSCFLPRACEIPILHSHRFPQSVWFDCDEWCLRHSFFGRFGPL